MEPPMTPAAYLDTRVQDQIDWHDAKSRWNKTWYRRLQGAVIVLGALLPFLAGFSGAPAPGARLAIGAVGVAVAVLTGLVTLLRFHDTWVEYRLTAERLTHEKYRYLTRTPPYDTDDAFTRLVERTEAILGEQNASWQHQPQPGAPVGAPGGSGLPPT